MEGPDDPELRDILLQAMDLPAADRHNFLLTACAGNEQRRIRVEAMLQSLEAADGFLESPTLAEPAPQPRELNEHAGSRIGRYKLQQQIGEGGFGVVFMAEQESPVRRTVALKIIKLGMDTRQVVARFEAERQALALMDHPHIAKVFDGGATDTGRPYFVMELVRGVPITTFCNENKLSTRQRLGLFLQVCSAVQHAHQKGIIHRDLKPSNVLVTVHDDKPVPKIIDFGVAKATQARLTEKTLFTEFRQMVGTPVYMSPEQAQISGMDVDTRSDIYSLGVLLYELLTGTTPFDIKELSAAAYDEMRRIIREVDPPAPSTRLSTLNNQALTAIADQRSCDPRALRSMVQGDLDWIILKALEKDRGRRYESASAFARDIERHLADQPVHARPAGAAYRLRKFTRRHKAGVAGGTLLILALAAAGITTTMSLIRTRDALKATEQQKLLAERASELALQRQQQTQREMAIARAAADFQDLMLRSAIDANNKAGDKLSFRDVTLHSAIKADHASEKLAVLQVIEEGLKRLDAGELKDQPLVEAYMRSGMGRTLWSMGYPDESEKVLRKSLELVRQAGVVKGAELIWPLENLVDQLDNQRRLQEEEPLAKELFELVSNAQMNPYETGNCMSYYGLCLAHQDRYVEAYVPLMRSFREFEKSGLLQRKKAGEWHEEVTMLILVVSELCDACQYVGKMEEARMFWVHLAEFTGAMPLRPDEPVPATRQKPAPAQMAVRSTWVTADSVQESSTGQVQIQALAANASGDLFAAANNFQATSTLVRSRQHGSDQWTTVLDLPCAIYAIACGDAGVAYFAAATTAKDGAHAGGILERLPGTESATLIDTAGTRAASVVMAPTGDLLALYEQLPPATSTTAPGTTTSPGTASTPIRVHGSLVRIRKAGERDFITILDTAAAGTPWTGWILRSALIVPSGPSAGMYVAGSAYRSLTDTTPGQWGVLKSSDGGNSWAVISRFTLDPTAASGIRSLIADKAGRIYATGVAVQDKLQHWLVRSSPDGGVTWKTDDDFQLVAGKASAANAFAINAAGDVLVAGWGQGTEGRQHALIRSNAGGTWRLIEEYASDKYSSSFNAVITDSVGQIYAAGMADDGAWLIRSGKPEALPPDVRQDP